MERFSTEHSLYLKKRHIRNMFVIFFRIIIVLLFLSIWECLSRIGVINTFMYSSPSKILSTFINLLVNGKLIVHIGITLFEVIISFIISIILGIFISSIMWSNKFISDVVDPYITILNSLPKVALGPLIILWFGAQINSIIFMSLMISLFVTIINIYQGFQLTDKNLITMIKSFGANKWQIFRYVVFPSNKSNIISTLKVNISMNLIGVIMGELLVSKKGLGYLIMYGSQVFNIDLVICCVVILGVISYLMYSIISFSEKKIVKN